MTVLGRHRRPLPDPLGSVETAWGPPVAACSLVLIAVPDDCIGGVALALAATGSVTAGHVVLHTSGLQDRSALAALDATGAGLGSWHPLQTFASPGGDPEALAGAPAVIEGDARGCAAGRALAERLQSHPVVEISAEGKPAYHAAAVVASNYLVVLADLAERLARDAGAGDAAQGLFAPLMLRTIANYGSVGPEALTGPISRGDAGTVARHLAALDGEERGIYVVMGRSARASGLDERLAQEIDVLLH